MADASNKLLNGGFETFTVANTPDSCTRTVSGKLVVSANAVEAGRSADQYRLWVEPPLGTNYKRESQEYTQSEDGLTLTFSVRDVEQMWSLPQPLSEGRVSWMVRVADRGLRVDYCLSGRFAAPATASKATIVSRIAALAAVKFPLDAAGVTLIFESRELTEDDLYGSNAVSFNITAWSAGGSGGGEFDFYTGLPTLGGKPPGSDGSAQKIGAYGGDGEANSGMVASAPKPTDACTALPYVPGNVSIGSGGGFGGGSGSGFNKPDDPVGGTSNNGVSSYHKQAPYVAFHEQTSYELDSGIVIFHSHAKDAAPIFQQTRPAIMHVIQAGYAIRVGQPPAVPQPYYSESQAVMLRPYVSTSTPEPIGSTGFNSYKLEWRYIMTFKATVTTSAGLGIGYGNDPRRQDDATVKGPALEGMPELVGKVQ